MFPRGRKWSSFTTAKGKKILEEDWKGKDNCQENSNFYEKCIILYLPNWIGP